MAVNFPTSLDTYTTHAASQVITSADVNKIQDTLAALEAKVGVDSSAVTSSLDYKVAHITGGVPGQMAPSDLGYKGWTSDMQYASSTGTPTAGVLYLRKVPLAAGTITNVHVYATGTGAPANVYGALYTSAGTLLAQTANQASGMTTSGLKTWALSSPQVITAGNYYLAFWMASSPVALLCTATSDNGLLGAGAYRQATANTGLTTTAPGPFTGMVAANSNAFWMACS